MNPLNPIISPELQKRVELALARLAKAYNNPRMLEAIKVVDEFIRKYHQKTLAGFGLLALHIKMGIPDFFNPSAREFKEDLANLVTHLYMLILETRGVPIFDQTKKDVYVIARKVASNIVAIKDKCDALDQQIQAGEVDKQEHQRSIITRLLESDLQAEQKIDAVQDIIQLFVRHGLLERTRSGYSFDALDDILALLSLRFENIIDISGILNKIIRPSDGEEELGQMAEYIIQAKNELWPQELRNAYTHLSPLTLKGMRDILVRDDTSLLFNVWQVCVGDVAMNDFRQWLADALQEIDGYETNKNTANLFVRISSLRSSELKEELVAAYDKHIKNLLTSRLESGKEIESLLDGVMQIRSQDLACNFKEKVLCTVFDLFNQPRCVYLQSTLLRLLNTHRKFFLDLHNKERWNADTEESGRIDFFNSLTARNMFTVNEADDVAMLAQTSDYYTPQLKRRRA